MSYSHTVPTTTGRGNWSAIDYKKWDQPDGDETILIIDEILITKSNDAKIIIETYIKLFYNYYNMMNE